jgi:hypothetical protein
MKDLGGHIYLFEDALAPEVCDEIVRRFEADERKAPGLAYGPNGPFIHEAKKSTDLRISSFQDWQDLDMVLFTSCSNAMNKFLEKHPELNMGQLRDTGYNIQRSVPGDRFTAHIDAAFGATVYRKVAFIWYLNDVEEGGETVFEFQGVTVKPKKGTMIMFPPFWTHRHEGRTPLSGTKYIITTFVEAVS